MAIPSSGTIKMGGTGTNSIAQEKAGTTSGTPTAVSSVSLKGLSVDGVRDFISGGSTNVDITGSPNQTAPYAMSEFHGYSQSFWPSAPGSITTNEDFIMDMYSNDELGNDVTSATVLNMSLNTTNKTLSWFFGNDADRARDEDDNSN